MIFSFDSFWRQSAKISILIIIITKRTKITKISVIPENNSHTMVLHHLQDMYVVKYFLINILTGIIDF